MIKHCFGVSLKASPVDGVLDGRLPEEIAERVVGVVGLMGKSENRILGDELKGS